MKCIIPLAGPDFISNGTIKALYEFEGKPLIETVLFSRPWFLNSEVTSEDFIFVLRDTEKTEDFSIYLKKTFKGCKIVILPGLTKGALLTSLSALSIINDFDTPICIDLADIIFDFDEPIEKIFETNNELSGIIPYFYSNNSCFSYLKIENDSVKLTKEKEVISSNASVGVYFFKNISKVLFCMYGITSSPSEFMYKNSYFVCPSYNYLIDKGELIKPVLVSNVKAVSMEFH